MRVLGYAAMLLAPQLAVGGTIEYGMTVGAETHTAQPTCNTIGAQVDTEGASFCESLAGRPAESFGFSRFGSIPFAENLSISSTVTWTERSFPGGPFIESDGNALAQATVPDQGYLASFEATGGFTPPTPSGQVMQTWGSVDLLISETMRIDIPSSYDGQAVSIVVNAPYEGTYYGFPNASSCGNPCTFTEGSMNISLSRTPADGGALIGQDSLTFGYQPSEVFMTGALSTGPVVIRSATSNASSVDLRFQFRALAGGSGFGTGREYDIDFFHTLYFDIDLPTGVTADLGILANRELSVVSGVPEPATLALLGLGFAGIAISRRRNLNW
jgi:hypothetical protein